MAIPDRILLVEGEADRSLFEVICENLGLNASVKVAPPKHIEGFHNGKEGVFNVLPIWLNQLSDATVTRLAVIIEWWWVQSCNRQDYRNREAVWVYFGIQSSWRHLFSTRRRLGRFWFVGDAKQLR